MTNGIKIILAIAGGLVLLCLVGAGVQTWRLNSAQSRLALVTGKLTEAQDAAVRWQATAKARAVSSEAQADLAAACIKREAQAREDAATIVDIMAQAKTKTITPEESRQGVDDATRQRAADMLNRPW